MVEAERDYYIEEADRIITSIGYDIKGFFQRLDQRIVTVIGKDHVDRAEELAPAIIDPILEYATRRLHPIVPVFEAIKGETLFTQQQLSSQQRVSLLASTLV